MDLREESHVILSCLLYWQAWAKHLSTTLSDHPSGYGHLVQGINSEQSHDTPGKEGVSTLILLVKN